VTRSQSDARQVGWIVTHWRFACGCVCRDHDRVFCSACWAILRIAVLRDHHRRWRGVTGVNDSGTGVWNDRGNHGRSVHSTCDPRSSGFGEVPLVCATRPPVRRRRRDVVRPVHPWASIQFGGAVSLALLLGSFRPGVPRYMDERWWSSVRAVATYESFGYRESAPPAIRGVAIAPELGRGTGIAAPCPMTHITLARIPPRRVRRVDRMFRSIPRAWNRDSLRMWRVPLLFRAPGSTAL